MKRTLALLLTLMLLILSMTAMAAETGITQPDNRTTNVVGLYEEQILAEAVYSVDIGWGGLEFDYFGGYIGVWQPDSHSYKDALEAGWTWSTEDGNNCITVTNNSNAAVTAQLAFAAADGLDITGAFKNAAEKDAGSDYATLRLGSAAPTEDSTTGIATTDSTYFHITGGDLTAEQVNGAEQMTIGTITVTLAAVSEKE